VERQTKRKKKASRVPSTRTDCSVGFWILGTPLSLWVARASDEQPLKFQYVEAAIGLGALQRNRYAMRRQEIALKA
jgi:hypothetical protein